MKELIIYYTYTGNNEILALDLQRRLSADIQRVVERKKRTVLTMILDVVFRVKPKVQASKVSLKKYERIILIAPVWWGRIASPLVQFVKLEKHNIRDYLFITLCGSGRNIKLKDELTQLLEKEPLLVTELSINKLLPPEKKDKVKYTSGYRAEKEDLLQFEHEISDFIQVARAPGAVL